MIFLWNPSFSSGIFHCHGWSPADEQCRVIETDHDIKNGCLNMAFNGDLMGLNGIVWWFYENYHLVNYHSELENKSPWFVDQSTINGHVYPFSMAMLNSQRLTNGDTLWMSQWLWQGIPIGSGRCWTSVNDLDDGPIPHDLWNPWPFPVGWLIELLVYHSGSR